MKTKPSFYVWLQLCYADLDCAAGDLAYDAKRDPEFPRKATRYEPLVRKLKERGACDGAIRTLKESHEIYLKTYEGWEQAKVTTARARARAAAFNAAA